MKTWGEDFGFAPLQRRWAQLVITLGFPFINRNSTIVGHAHCDQGQLPKNTLQGETRIMLRPPSLGILQQIFGKVVTGKTT